MIAHVERRHSSSNSLTVATSSLRIRCKDFTFLSFNFNSDQHCKDAFDSMLKLTCLSDITKIYAFMYKPGSLERSQPNGWSLYDPLKEFERMGTFSLSKSWRTTNINADYSFSPTYPAFLVVPSQISDTVLNYGSKYRSKLRIPALSYYHKFNGCTITRCSQPMVGLKQSRSAQDEKVISAIFASTQTPGIIGATAQDNLVVDARPTTNAMAQTALGAGTENMENYKAARKVYLGIDNIHVMRESLNKVNEALRDGDISSLAPNKEILYRSNWLRYLSIIIEGALVVVRQVHYKFAHVLVHCSDGWDRTSQISSLAQIFLDPYFRTLDGFIILVEKEWLSFGHRFAERSGHLNSEKHFVQRASSDNQGVSDVLSNVSNRFVNKSHVKYTSPVFHQFLDCVYQAVRQFPDRFEYNERFLRRLLYHTYSCQYGTFLFNNEKERKDAQAETRSRSVWDYFLARRAEFVVGEGSGYNKEREAGLDAAEGTILLPDAQKLKWWPELYGRTEQEMNRAERKIYDPKIESPIPSVSRPISPPVSRPSVSRTPPSSAPATSPTKKSKSPETHPLVTSTSYSTSLDDDDDNPYTTSLQDTRLVKPSSLDFPKTHIQPLGDTSTLYTTHDDEDDELPVVYGTNTGRSPYDDDVDDDDDDAPIAHSLKSVLAPQRDISERLDPRVYASFNAMTMDSESKSTSSRRYF